MATQALYRRYRPRRFSEVRGQEHIVRALRNAVINHREGQAYLFSGPRGTGKTTSARILAKVLNCERPVDGEPCCECDSCLAVERGTSYDVHELDAASNNGVDAMRDLIERASLGTPGRHKVYILDEVHMLSKAAEAALLKTLEEPPPHVVFVLATTDPQKVSDTIRSRTQHLRFHLLPMDELEQHIRWVATDAGLEVSEAAIMSALEQGGGSARDTLSALELVASTGGDTLDVVQFDEFVESLIELDPGRALTAVAHAVQQGRDPRSLTEDVVRYLRDCFLSLMAPELVALPDSRATVVAEQAVRLGAGRLVKAMERLGEILVEMRHAPDARLLLEVALVQLTHQAAAHDLGALIDRVERLEKTIAEGSSTRPSGPSPTPTLVDPATGRVPLGGRARRDVTAGLPRPSSTSSPEPDTTPAPASAPASAATSIAADASASAGGTRETGATEPNRDDPPAEQQARQRVAAPEVSSPSASVVDHRAAMVSEAVADESPDLSARPGSAARPSATGPATTRPATTRPATSGAGSAGSSDSVTEPAAAGTSGSTAAADAAARWSNDIVPALKPLARAIFSVPKLLGVRDGALTLGAPNDAHRAKCEQHRADVERIATSVIGSSVRVVVITDASARSVDHDDHHDHEDHPDHLDQKGPDGHGERTGRRESGVGSSTGASVVQLHPAGPPHGSPSDDDDIDLDDLVDAPPESVVSPIDRLAQAFPGSELLDERL